MRIRPLFAVALLGCAATTLACRMRHDKSDVHVVMRDANAKPDSLGPGDVRVFNADSSLELELVGDWISTGLSQKVVDQVKRDAARDAGRDSGLGGAIASIVTKTVANTIGMRIEIPLADVQDVRYDNGTLVFDWKPGHKHDLFERGKVNGRQADKSFTPEEGNKFVTAVKQRIAERSQPVER